MTAVTVAPNGDIVKNSGQNHLLISRMSIAAGEFLTFDGNHRHFGACKTQTIITLPPGLYKLTSQFANGEHQLDGAPMSASIRITLK